VPTRSVRSLVQMNLMVTVFIQEPSCSKPRDTGTDDSDPHGNIMIKPTSYIYYSNKHNVREACVMGHTLT